MRIGEKYERLTVIDLFNKGGRKYARCVCDCGNSITARTDGIKSGHTRSCGCYKKELQRKRIADKNHTHGMSRTRLYGIWGGIVQRCTNKKSRAYRYYGGRGIRVCDEWRHDFIAFHDWAMANGYDETLTLDRIDNDGDYCPENCRWITQSEQMGNTRNNRRITFNGETKCLAEWARVTGIQRKTIANRIDRLGWSISDALTKEVVKA